MIKELEIGRWYKTSDGKRVVKIIRADGNVFLGRYYDEEENEIVSHWCPLGHWMYGNRFDLVEEIDAKMLV